MQVVSIGVMALRFGLGALLLLSSLCSTVVSDQESSQAKGAVKIVQTEHGDIYECVDFYKQPGFNHPALKNHDFHPEMRPTYRPNKTSSTSSYINNPKTISFGLKDKACPRGTVPIRKMEDRDLNQVGTTSKNLSMSIKSRQRKGTLVAISRSKSPQEYHGVMANLTIHHPSIARDEYSSGQISIKNGPDSIQVGWTVNPLYYKDDKTRMFIYTDAGGQSCYNTDCPGFIIVRSDIPLDSVLAPFSEPRGPNSYVDFVIFQDKTFKIWWLAIGHNQEPIGFWSDRIFTHMAESASYVECGGEVYQDYDKQGGIPMMGNGFKPSKHEEGNAYCYNFNVVERDWIVRYVKDTETYSDHEAYGVQDKFVPKHGLGLNIVLEFEHVVIYGGTQKYS